VKIYKHNTALNTYQLLGEISDDGNPRDILRARLVRLDRLRAFVVFEVHYSNGTREVFERGLA
jgi:hypothetical protein